VKRLRGLSGFLVDLTLGSLAWALELHPVEDFVRTHERILPWSLTALHATVIPLLFVQMIAGHTKNQDLLDGPRAGSLDERISTWSMVLSICSSFVVPGVLTLGMRGSDVVQMLTATLGPFLLIIACGFAIVKLEKREIAVPDLFASAPRRLGITLVIWAYLALMEITMILAAESGAVIGGVFPFVGAALSYLPVRFYLFYATDAHRAQRISVLLCFVGLLIRLAVATCP